MVTWADSDSPRQLIIIRGDLNMPAGKVAAQIAHASQEWLRQRLIGTIVQDDDLPVFFEAQATLTKTELAWLQGSRIEIICEAKDERDLLKTEQRASSRGMFLGVDWFRIYDERPTDAQSEKHRKPTLAAIGFTPLPADTVKWLSKKYKLR